MYLLVLKATGHVLAAYTEVPKGADPTIENLCGADFMVGSVRTAAAPADPITIAVAREQIEVRSAPLDADVLANPRGFVADGSTTTPIVPPTQALQAVTLDPNLIDVPDFAGKQGLVVLNRSDDPTHERRLGTPPEQAPFDSVTLKTSPSAAIVSPISAAAGTDYDVLIAVPGRPLALLVVTA